MRRVLTQRVARGMAHLDNTNPGWRRYVMSELIERPFQSSPSYILAIGGMDRATKLVGRNGLEWSIRMGLCADPNAMFGPRVKWTELDAAWRRILVAQETK